MTHPQSGKLQEWLRGASMASALALCALGAPAMAATAGGAPDATRSSATLQYRQAEGRGSAAAPSQDELEPLRTGPTRQLPAPRAAKLAEGATRARDINQDFWFYDANARLFYDDDRDGYYHGIELVFDVDTYYPVAEVYAVVYLSLEGGPWNEYAATEVFTLFGASGLDDYVIETELLAGYPTGDYDLLIDVYDAYSDRLVASIGPESESSLALLPLEDAGRDIHYPAHSVTVSHGGGGTAGAWLLIGLALAGLRRRQRQA